MRASQCHSSLRVKKMKNAVAERAPRSMQVSRTKFQAVNEEPQPQPPVAFGFVKVKPEPITPVT